MMLEFRKAELCDKEVFDRILEKCEELSLEYNFTTFFIWQDIFNMEFATEGDVLCIRAGKEYLFPVGSGYEAVADRLIGEGVNFYSLSERQREYIENKAPGTYEFDECRDDGDYIYTAESLGNLTGKKLSAKRNHINKFISENPDWQYEMMTEQNLEEVKKMYHKWYEAAEKVQGLEAEGRAVEKALEHFSELRLSGGLIRSHGDVIAFSMGDKLSGDTFLVHIEKAFSDIQGAYQIINREFVRNAGAGYEFINREDDAGDEGLRRAKMSYRPYKILKKYTARKK